MAVSVGTMELKLSMAIMQVTTSLAFMQWGGTFSHWFVSGSFCSNYAVRSFCSTYADDTFCSRVTIVIVIRQMEVSVKNYAGGINKKNKSVVLINQDCCLTEWLKGRAISVTTMSRGWAFCKSREYERNRKFTSRWGELGFSK